MEEISSDFLYAACVQLSVLCPDDFTVIQVSLQVKSLLLVHNN